VRSVLNQTFRDFELVIVDDGSSDSTPEILRRLVADDPRIAVVTTPPRGLVEALNLGVSQSNGSLIARMDADDEALPSRFEQQVAELNAKPRLGAIGCQVSYIDASGRPAGAWDLPVGPSLVRWRLYFGTALAHPAVVMRRSSLPATPYADDAPHAEDYDLWVKIAQGSDLDNLSQVLLRRRVHGASVSDVHETEQAASVDRVQRRVIETALGVGPDSETLRALRGSGSRSGAVKALPLLARLYRAFPDRTPSVRADAIGRARTLVRAGLSR
jgi:glycosyltransferase involved in cell wall biosynthesis